MQADATSRLVLDEANVDEAECVIITTTSEIVNIEVCRLLKEHFRPKRVIAVGTSSEGIKRLIELGAEVQDLFAVSATGIRNLLEQRARTATTIGLGKNEILEVELHPHSRLANKQIGNLAPIRWKIGIIYRDGNIIIPRRDTVLKPRDRVVILGDPGVLKTVAEIMTFRFQQFPQEYGTMALIYLTGIEDERFFAEVEYLFSVFALQHALFITSGRAAGQAHRYQTLIQRGRYPTVEIRQIDLPPDDAAARILTAGDPECGIVVLHAGMLQLKPFSPISKQRVLRLCGVASCPVLIARGTASRARDRPGGGLVPQ
jgi:Trk K+ transport system NAD-binding subunit